MTGDLEHIPDPSSGPDERAADLVDGPVESGLGLLRWARAIAALPPRIAEAITTAYAAAKELPPEEAARFHPTRKDLAERLGMSRQALSAAIRRALKAADGATACHPSRAVDKLSTGGEGGSPRGRVLARPGHPLPRERRGRARRATNEEGERGRRGRGEGAR